MRRFATREAELPWWIALAGFAAMYLPLYWWAAFSENALWQTDEHGHGALILLVLIWLFWGMREAIFAAPTRPSRRLGWTLFAIGLLLYVIGRVIGIAIFMFGSQPFVVAAILLLLRGPDAIRIAWFALFYFIFMIPLPGIFVDTVTGPLKQWISAIVVELLYRVGYPISRTGVIISIGQYQMLVADACSGLHSMYSLSALGTLFMYIMGRKSVLHNAIMLASILPIAFAANVVRVVVLVLVTYHFGDAAGQGFLHGAAGIVLILVALLLFFALDSLLGRILPPPGPPSGSAEPSVDPATRATSDPAPADPRVPPLRGTGMQPRWIAWGAAALMCGAAIAGIAGKPRAKDSDFPKLEAVVPKQFGEWAEVREHSNQIVDPETQQLLNSIYDQVLTRTYANKQGYRIMLSLAYGSDQRGGLQAHRPEVCYPAQGFKVLSLDDGDLDTSKGAIHVRRLTTNMGQRDEPVTYWLTVGDHVIRNKFDKRMMEFRLMLTGQIPDGLLFRVSSIDKDAKRAFETQQRFVDALMGAVPADIRRQLSGIAPAQPS